MAHVHIHVIECICFIMMSATITDEEFNVKEYLLSQ